jgi:chromosome segregation ATPase
MNKELAAADAAKRFMAQFKPLLEGIELLGELGSLKNALAEQRAELVKVQAEKDGIRKALDNLRKKTEDELTQLRARAVAEVNEKHRAADEAKARAVEAAKADIAKAAARETAAIKALEERKTLLTENVDKLRAQHESLITSVKEQTKKLLELNNNVSASQSLHDDLKARLADIKHSL